MNEIQTQEPGGESLPVIGGAQMPLGMRLMFDDKLYDRCKQLAKILSQSEGFIPSHLVGKSEACFAIVTRALTWQLDPFAVASCTYQTPGGRVGYEGKLVQAILENSGRFEGPIFYQHYGDWTRVAGKFQIRKSERGKDFAVPTWTREDAKGLGVTVKGKVRGEAEPREWPFDLEQAFPLNSTLWATDPRTQICYAAARRFANIAAPGVLMGVPFDFDPSDAQPAMRDVTPETRTRPQAGSLDEVVAQRRGQAAPPADDPAGQEADEAELLQEKKGEETGRQEPEDDDAEQHRGDDTGGGDDAGDDDVDPGTGEVSTSPPAGLTEQTTIECVIGNRAMYVAPDVGARHLLEHCTRVGSVAEIDKALERNRGWLDAATLDRIAELRAGRASATAKGGKR